MLDFILGSPLEVGSPAPDFSVPDQDGSRVTLSAHRGRNVILIFYPGDDTPLCTKQLCEFRDNWSEVQKHNAVVFGVNPARSRSHEKFRTRYNFQFPLLIDKDLKLAKLYKTDGPFKFMVRRTVYLIGPDGIIRYAKRGKPSPAEVLAAAA